MSAPRRLRVVVLNRRFGVRFGGAERYSVELVRELAPLHDIHVFAQDIDHDVKGIHTHRVPILIRRPRWLNQLWFAAWTWWKTRGAFDLVHSHENTWHGDVQTIHVRPFRLGLVRGRVGLARHLRIGSIALSPRRLSYWILESLRMRRLRGRQIIASSVTLRDEILAAWPQLAPAMHVLSPGVRVPEAAESSGSNVGREALGLPTEALGAPLALFVANDLIKKGLPVLLAALAQVEGLHLMVVTAQAAVAKTLALARRAGVADRVHPFGRIADISLAYRAADFLVHPTTEDTYAMVVLEAMAWALPVIVSDARHCGIAAELRDRVDAILLEDPGNVARLAALIRELINDEALAHALRCAGPEFAAQRTWAIQAQALQRVYEEAGRMPAIRKDP